MVLLLHPTTCLVPDGTTLWHSPLPTDARCLDNSYQIAFDDWIPRSLFDALRTLSLFEQIGGNPLISPMLRPRSTPDKLMATACRSCHGFVGPGRQKAYGTKSVPWRLKAPVLKNLSFALLLLFSMPESLKTTNSILRAR